MKGSFYLLFKKKQIQPYPAKGCIDSNHDNILEFDYIESFVFTDFSFLSFSSSFDKQFQNILNMIR